MLIVVTLLLTLNIWLIECRIPNSARAFTGSLAGCSSPLSLPPSLARQPLRLALLDHFAPFDRFCTLSALPASLLSRLEPHPSPRPAASAQLVPPPALSRQLASEQEPKMNSNSNKKPSMSCVDFLPPFSPSQDLKLTQR